MFKDGNLFDLHVSFWRGRKGLKAEDVGLEEKNIPEIVILGQKMLVPEEELRKFTALESKIRGRIEALTFRFPVGVTSRFVPFTVLKQVIEIAEAGAEEFSTLVEKRKGQFKWRKKSLEGNVGVSSAGSSMKQSESVH